MTSATARTIQRRDAAVTAALVGAVLVILGYASGIGLKPQSEVAASLTQPQAPATTPAGEVSGPSQPASAAPLVAAPVLGAGSAHESGPAPAAPIASHAPSQAPAPEPPRHPTPPVPTPVSSPSCASDPAGPVSGLLGGLPLVSDVATLVDGLLGTPLLALPSANASASVTADPTGGLLDPLLGDCTAALRVPADGTR